MINGTFVTPELGDVEECLHFLCKSEMCSNSPYLNLQKKELFKDWK